MFGHWRVLRFKEMVLYVVEFWQTSLFFNDLRKTKPAEWGHDRFSFCVQAKYTTWKKSFSYKQYCIFLRLFWIWRAHFWTLTLLKLSHLLNCAAKHTDLLLWKKCSGCVFHCFAKLNVKIFSITVFLKKIKIQKYWVLCEVIMWPRKDGKLTTFAEA